MFVGLFYMVINVYSSIIGILEIISSDLVAAMFLGRIRQGVDRAGAVRNKPWHELPGSTIEENKRTDWQKQDRKPQRYLSPLSAPEFRYNFEAARETCGFFRRRTGKRLGRASLKASEPRRMKRVCPGLSERRNSAEGRRLRDGAVGPPLLARKETFPNNAAVEAVEAAIQCRTSVFLHRRSLQLTERICIDEWKTLKLIDRGYSPNEGGISSADYFPRSTFPPNSSNVVIAFIERFPSDSHSIDFSYLTFLLSPSKFMCWIHLFISSCGVPDPSHFHTDTAYLITSP
jgi:hypothetical protein